MRSVCLQQAVFFHSKRFQNIPKHSKQHRAKRNHGLPKTARLECSRQHALSTDREQGFPSCLSRAGRCCVAHPSRSRYRLQLFDAEQIAARNIGPDVGNVQNNRPDLIVPFELDNPGGPPLLFKCRLIFLNWTDDKPEQRDEAPTSAASLRAGLLLGPYVLAARALEAI